MKTAHTETIVALSTPLGESALAVIRLSGPLSQPIAQSVFKLNTPPQPRAAKVGYYTDIEGNLKDHCSYTVFEAPKSFTGEDMLELNPHGNPLIINNIIKDMEARGCRLALPGEFTRRAFENDKIDLTQAEAICDLIHAKSQRALTLAQRQLQGALGRHIADLTTRLIKVLAHIEAYIDFPEDDLPDENTEGPRSDLVQLKQEIQVLLNNRDKTPLLSQGIRTVILGAPNAGKSSLLNALLGRERALVSEQPGTTRDFITEYINIGDHTIQLVDTAGLRETNCPIESLGIGHSLDQAQQADLLLWVLDQSEPSPTLPLEIQALLEPHKTLGLLNKADLPLDPSHASWQGTYEHVCLSLKTGNNVQNLLHCIQTFIEKNLLPSTCDDFLINRRQSAALEAILGYLSQALDTSANHGAPELIASDIRLAIDSLGEIVGKIDNERILDQLFSDFCIGK